MVGVDKDRKEKIVGEMIQRDVPLMMSVFSRIRLRGGGGAMVSSCVHYNV